MNKINNMRVYNGTLASIWQQSKFPWYLLLTPISYLMQVFIVFHGDITFYNAIKQLIVWQLILVFAILLLRSINSIKKYIELIVFSLSILYFYFNLLIAIYFRRIPLDYLRSQFIFILCWLLITFVIIIYFKFHQNKLPRFLNWIKASSIVITLYFIIKIGVFFYNMNEFNLKFYKPQVEFAKISSVRNKLPNIYFLIIDSYTSNNLLQTEFNYNNTLIYSFLKEQGFYIADSSTSNYFYSPVSIAATLNLGYLPKAAFPKDQNDLVLFSGLRMIQKPSLLNFLKEQNYEVLNLSPFSIRNSKSKIESYYKGGSDEELLKYNTVENTNLLEQINHTYLKFAKGKRFSNYKEEEVYRIKKDMQTITNEITQLSLKKNRTPHFIYVHTNIPHHPYLIDSTGADIEPQFRMDTSHNGYIKQLAFTNTYLKKWVTQIRKYDSLAIIILQGDHGFRAFPKEQNKTDAFKILNAIYFPDQNYKSLYPTISSVNTFRVVLNNYFQQNLPLLRDSSFFPNF